MKWWVIPAQQEEPLLNLQSPTPSCPLFPSPSFNPPPSLPLSPRSLLHMPGWSAEYGWRWRDGGMGGMATPRERGWRCGGGVRGGVALSWLSLLLSPVSHLRRCGTRINGIQQHGEILAGSVCACVCSRWASGFTLCWISISQHAPEWLTEPGFFFSL